MEADRKKSADNTIDKEKGKSFGRSPLLIVLAILGVIFILDIFFMLGRISTYYESNRGHMPYGPGRMMDHERWGNGNQRGGCPMEGQKGELSGQITALGNNSFTIKTDGKEYTVNISDSTSLQKSGEIAKKSDLKTGDQVSVYGPSNSNGEINAKMISIK